MCALPTVVHPGHPFVAPYFLTIVAFNRYCLLGVPGSAACTPDLGNPAAALGLENQKEDLGQTLGTYGVGGGCYFVLPILGPTTVRDSLGMVLDNQYLDTFARVTWHEEEIKSMSGNKVDYVGVKAATAVDFRGDNMINFESLEKNSIDLYAATKSLYLQNRENKINNSSDGNNDWGNLDN